jgi:hypothetical protein
MGSLCPAFGKRMNSGLTLVFVASVLLMDFAVKVWSSFVGLLIVTK